MERRKFLKSTALLSGLITLSDKQIFAKNTVRSSKRKKAQNVIFMISDGMSTGTLAIADLYSKNILGKSSNWMNLYLENKVVRALMDTASASSIVTDSAAASSALGGGIRVKNGMLNIGVNGEEHLPIWKECKMLGKKAGCVTTVAITHATPAGFCINSAIRNAEPKIAEMYADIGFDVMMGGGDEFFNPQKREDKKDLYSIFEQKGYQVLKDRTELKTVAKDKSILGVFSQGALPYSIDRANNLNDRMPTLAEMTKTAIDQMKDHKDGFVLQVEGGKVDWAAHANDISALIHEQLDFDKAIKVAMDFAESDGNTLVVITTDHGNANPGVIYGPNATKSFESISDYSCSNEYLLNSLNSYFNIQQIKDLVYHSNKIKLSNSEALDILSFYNGLEKESGIYNYKKLPYKLYSEIQKKHNAVGWISMDHSSDYVELAAYGPGSELLKPFVKNTELHSLMKQAIA